MSWRGCAFEDQPRLIAEFRLEESGLTDRNGWPMNTPVKRRLKG